MQNFTEIFPTKCLNRLSSTRQTAGFINNASMLTNRSRQLVFRSFCRRSRVVLFSHQLAFLCQFLDVDITSNCVLKTRGAKTVSELSPLALERVLMELSHGGRPPPPPLAAFPFKCTLRKKILPITSPETFFTGWPLALHQCEPVLAGTCAALGLLQSITVGLNSVTDILCMASHTLFFGHSQSQKQCTF